MESQGINPKVFKQNKEEGVRSTSILIIKNLPNKVSVNEFKELV